MIDFDKDTAFTQQVLGALTARSKMALHNIANQNTPGYKRREVQFEALLAQEMERSAPNLDAINPATVVDRTSAARGDGNNVVLETEMTDMREATLKYDLYAALLRSRTSIVRSAIREGR